MKLTCDLCGSELQMTSGGQGAVCTNCGLTYSMERLREKLGIQTAEPVKPQQCEEKTEPVQAEPSYNQEQVYEAKWKPVDTAPPVRQLYIKRRVDFLLLSKVAVIIDGQQVGFLAGQGKASAIPVSKGPHRITFRVADGSGITDMDEMTFHVGDHDLYGEFYLHRGAFKAEYRFELRECV